MRSTDNTIHCHKSIQWPVAGDPLKDHGEIHRVCNYAANLGIFEIDPRVFLLVPVLVLVLRCYAVPMGSPARRSSSVRCRESHERDAGREATPQRLQHRQDPRQGATRRRPELLQPASPPPAFPTLRARVVEKLGEVSATRRRTSSTHGRLQYQVRFFCFNQPRSSAQSLLIDSFEIF